MHEVLEGSDRYKIDYIHDGSIASSPEAVSPTQIADPAATSQWRPATAARPSILTGAVVDWQTLHTSPTGDDVSQRTSAAKQRSDSLDAPVTPGSGH